MILALVATLAALAALSAWLVLTKRVWAISVITPAMALAAVLLITASRALPVPGQPPLPFVLWSTTGHYSWISPGGPDAALDSAPRTYRWSPPPDARRALAEGVPLLFSADPADAGEQSEDADAGAEPGLLERSAAPPRWTPLEPQGAEKPAP